MMTRTTFKTLWFGGGGVIATWLAVNPAATPPAGPPTAMQRAAATSGPAAEDLNAQATRLRERTAALALRPSTRNPFRFNSKPATRETLVREQMSLPVPAQAMPAPAGPILKLSGVARNGGTHTAIISGDGQLYLVAEGDSVAGRYTVVKVGPEAVLLRDAAGAEQQLSLPR